MSPEHGSENTRVWQNAWGITMAQLVLRGEQATGFRAWFEPPHAGWHFPHIDLIGMGEFVCRASAHPNDFIADLIEALQGILGRKMRTAAVAHGEPRLFEFRFSRTPRTRQVRFELVSFPTVVPAEDQAEVILSLGPNGDTVCRAFCFGLRHLQQEVSAADYQAEIGYPFPAEQLAVLCERLGGEFTAPPETP
jgi:hypothetical protein